MTELCPRCGTQIKKVNIAIHGAKSIIKSMQCPECDYYNFDNSSVKKVIEELKTDTKKDYLENMSIEMLDELDTQLWEQRKKINAMINYKKAFKEE